MSCHWEWSYCDLRLQRYSCKTDLEFFEAIDVVYHCSKLKNQVVAQNITDDANLL